MFAVVYETAYKTEILFQGTLKECKVYMRMNPEMCADGNAFVQELENV